MDQLAWVAFFPKGAGEAQVKAWVVDENDGLGLQLKDFVPDREEELREARECSDEVDEAHRLELFHVEKRIDSKLSHPRACHTADGKRGIDSAERFDQACSMQIATGLAGEYAESVTHAALGCGAGGEVFCGGAVREGEGEMRRNFRSTGCRGERVRGG